MRAKTSRRLVIDASVARAAGGAGATYPLSKQCRDALKTVLDVCHRAVMPSAIREEWNKHQSVFATQWRVAMVARKKLLLEDVPADPSLRREIETAPATEPGREAMLKDVHLVEAAQAADRTILSLDDTARGLFAGASRRVRALRTIVWVNPGAEGDRALAWLEAGAPPEAGYRLPARAPRP
ncbi:hypothetical protein WMF39_47370 [Sorangium sp. So ce1504]|uniref:hypothetical protein n=1 Tax=Sorangium sp. So ce1504 TaxID=3133337 RepID=UPI003F5EBAD5